MCLTSFIINILRLTCCYLIYWLRKNIQKLPVKLFLIVKQVLIIFIGTLYIILCTVMENKYVLIMFWFIYCNFLVIFYRHFFYSSDFQTFVFLCFDIAIDYFFQHTECVFKSHYATFMFQLSQCNLLYENSQT